MRRRQFELELGLAVRRLGRGELNPCNLHYRFRASAPCDRQDDVLFVIDKGQAHNITLEPPVDDVNAAACLKQWVATTSFPVAPTPTNVRYPYTFLWLP